MAKEVEEPIVIPLSPGEISQRLLDEEKRLQEERTARMERARAKIVQVFVEENVTLQEFASIITKVMADNNKVVDQLTVKEILERHAS